MTYPADVAQQIARLQEQAAQVHDAAGDDRERAERYQHAYEQLGPLRRRGQDGRRLKERVDGFTARVEEQQAHGDQLEDQARTLAAGPGSPGAWEGTHPGAREQLYAAESALADAVDDRARHPQPGAGFDRDDAHRELAWLRAERDRHLTDFAISETWRCWSCQYTSAARCAKRFWARTPRETAASPRPPVRVREAVGPPA